MITSTRLSVAALAGACLGLAACSGDSTSPTPAPSAPASLTANAAMTQVTLNWLVPPGAVDEIRIQRAVGAGAFAALVTLRPAVGTYTDAGLAAGTALKYQVVACNTGGCSTAAEISVTTPTTNNQTPLAIFNPALPPSLVNYAYNPIMRTEGGSGGNPTWTLLSGALPTGLRFNADGTFTGTPTATGTFPLTLRATAGGESAQRDFSLRIFQPDLTRWNVTRMDVKPVPAEIEPAVQAAIAKWESVITRDLHVDTIPNGFYRPGDCGGFGRATEGSFIDDMLLIVNIGTLPGNVIAQATVCGYRYDDETSVIGVLTLSAPYLRTLAGSSTITGVIFHEIGHTLGYGIMWDTKRFEPTSKFDYLASGTCVWDDAGNLTIGTDPTYTGPRAVKEWNDAGKAGNVPIEDTGGTGTACSHWREASFKSEVMTGFAESTGEPMPLSRITIASMADLGFTVDLSKADPYTPPAAPAMLRAPSPWTIGGDLMLPIHWEDVQVGGRPRPLRGKLAPSERR